MTDSGSNKRKVRFKPDNFEIVVDEGTNLLEAAIAAGVHISAACGGNGVCGTCKVLIEKGEVATERTQLVTDEEFTRGVRQACQSTVLSDLTVYVPIESRLEQAVIAREREVQPGAVATGWRFHPPLYKYYVEMTPPTIEDNAADLSRLLRALKQQYGLSNMWVDFEVVKKLAEVVRDGNWKVTVTTLITAAKPAGQRRRPRVMNVEPGDTRQKHYSLAIDIGTTTVCGQLLELNRGKVIAEHMAFNKQIKYGADVITRIAYSQKPGGLETLQEAVVSTINDDIDEMLFQSGIERKDIGHLTVAGNTTMTQLVLGLDPRYIRLAPYVPVANFFPPVKANTVGINLADHVYLYTFPAVSSYVGGDIVSGVIAAGVHQRRTLTFYMDIGTNGEIVIGNSEWMVTASCSAGPAFEGGGVRHGMVARKGAIQDFEIDPKTYEPTIHTIGDEKPKGICGSGMINIVAGLLEVGAIGQDGKFNTQLPTKRIRESIDGYEYVLAWAHETQTDHDIVITEVDIDNLIRAKAAMFAGCQTLTKAVSMDYGNFEQVILAGNFGSSVNIEKAITIGMLPDIPRDRFIFIGNGSLSGARLVSYSTDLMDDARRVAQMMTNFELSENPDFVSNYVAALFLPHTNADAFPTVSKKLASARKTK